LQLPEAHDEEKLVSEEFAVANAEKSLLFLVDPHFGHVTSSCFKEDL
jgi:hypothetical protein